MEGRRRAISSPRSSAPRPTPRCFWYDQPQFDGRATVIRWRGKTANDCCVGCLLDRPLGTVRGTIRAPVGAWAQAMSCLRSRRGVAGKRTRLDVGAGERRRPTHGRQGKRPSFGAAYVVGKIGEITDLVNTRRWRFRHIAQAFQGFERCRSEFPSGRCVVTPREDDLQLRPGRIQDGNRSGKRPQTFVGLVMRAAKKAGHARRQLPLEPVPQLVAVRKGPARGGLGPTAIERPPPGDEGARLRHQCARFRSAPLPKHISYLKRFSRNLLAPCGGGSWRRPKRSSRPRQGLPVSPARRATGSRASTVRG